MKEDALLHLVLVPQPNLPSLYDEEGDRAGVYGLAGSLYARCGGIFGIAAFVDPTPATLSSSTEKTRGVFRR